MVSTAKRNKRFRKYKGVLIEKVSTLFWFSRKIGEETWQTANR